MLLDQPVLVTDKCEVFSGSIYQDKNWTDFFHNQDNGNAVAWAIPMHFVYG